MKIKTGLMEIRSDVYWIFQKEIRRLGQTKAAKLFKTSQSNISRAIHHPEKVSLSWYIQCLKKLGYKINLIIKKEK